ncbi:MAG: DNA polymerase III subunit epsilon [Candidatus Marinimicrobia bacterium]|nr:DNA polymerase III subunit epsilon [Candidatus Neomarinimicrobiota bacterium]
MREIILDTETTGLDPGAGHRVVEVGCLELENHVATGNEYHVYLNPERDMPYEAEAVHGLSIEFLSTKPLFSDIAEEFINFLGDSDIVAHNAGFDLSFINAELKRAGHPAILPERTIDTVKLARRKFPGAQVSLDALCKRFQIDTSAREKHGALLDAQLLSQVYLELIGGREPGLELAAADTLPELATTSKHQQRKPRHHSPSPKESAAHADFVASIKDAIWTKI